MTKDTELSTHQQTAEEIRKGIIHAAMVVDAAGKAQKIIEKGKKTPALLQPKIFNPDAEKGGFSL